MRGCGEHQDSDSCPNKEWTVRAPIIAFKSVEWCNKTFLNLIKLHIAVMITKKKVENNKSVPPTSVGGHATNNRLSMLIKMD